MNNGDRLLLEGWASTEDWIIHEHALRTVTSTHVGTWVLLEPSQSDLVPLSYLVCPKGSGILLLFLLGKNFCHYLDVAHEIQFRWIHLNLNLSGSRAIANAD